jgi:hypothetical protein|uniref:hypothetical protein n=1 Tax=Prosthecobacter sp. TaxID=1965333 RepID=UPI003783F0D5
MKPQRALILIALAFASVLPASAADRLEQWYNLMPKGTTVVVAVKNTQELLADWDKSTFSKFMQDEAVQRWTAPMRQEGVAPWDKFFKEHYGTGMHDTLKDYPGALLNFLVINDPEDFKKNPPSVALCEIAGKEKEIEAHKLSEVEAEKKKNAALKIENASIAGVSVQIATDDPEDDACFTAWAVVGDVMIESTSRKLLEQMITAVQSGSADAAADAREHLTRIGQLTNGGGDMLIYFNGVKFLELGQKALAEAEKAKKGGEKDAMAAMGITPQIIMNMLGVQELQAVAITMELQDGQMRSDFTILHPEKPAGLVSLMRTTANEVALPVFIPGDVLQGGVTRYDFGKFYDGIMGMIMKLGPMAMMVTMQIPQFEQQLGFKIRDDFFGSLEDEISTVQDGALDKQSQVLAFKIKSADKIGGALESLKRYVGAGFGAFEESDYLGYSVNTLKLSQTSSAASEMAYCNTGKHLLISIGAPSTLNKVLSRMKDPSGPSIWENAQVQKLLAAVPPNYGSATVADVGSMISMIATAASTLEAQNAGKKKAAAQKKGPGKKAAADDTAAASGSMLDSSAIPPKEVFQRYFGRMLGTQYSHPDAVQIHYLVIPPEE